MEDETLKAKFDNYNKNLERHDRQLASLEDSLDRNLNKIFDKMQEIAVNIAGMGEKLNLYSKKTAETAGEVEKMKLTLKGQTIKMGLIGAATGALVAGLIAILPWLLSKI